MRQYLTALLFMALAPATMAQPVVNIAGLFPLIQPSGFTAHLQPLITVPPESATDPLARINYVQALHDGSGRLFMNDVNGILYESPAAGGTATPYLNINTQNVGAITGGASIGPGFAGFAFHPNFGIDPTKPGYDTFYTSTNIANPGASVAGVVNLGNGTGSNVIQIREWTALDPKAATFSGTSRVVMDISGYFDAHSNASIGFNTTAIPGSADYGNLYIASGDGHYNDADQNAQNLAAPQGKLLRINPLAGLNGEAYTIPADNPFVGTPGALPEVWAYGLRFPQTFSWDPLSGTMYINDLGQAAIEEVDVGKAGANYGWSQREGTFATGYSYGLGSTDENIYTPAVSAASLGFTDPIAEYSHVEGNALGSGFLYRGTLIPALDGKYIMADIVNGRFFVFDPASVIPGGVATLTEMMITQDGQVINLDNTLGYPNPYDVGNRLDARLEEDANGELLLALKSTGQVYALVGDVPEPASALLVLTGLVPAWLSRRSKRSAA
jgi:hypothetical protein